MNAKLFEGLLYQTESEVLDFKIDQYPFEAATDVQKSELLKDILSFANAWRRSDAYILIGVEEIRVSFVESPNNFLTEICSSLSIRRQTEQ